MSTAPAPPPIEPQSLFAGLRPRAIVIGAIVDYLATFVALTGLFILLAIQRSVDLSGDVPDEVFEELLSSPEGLFWGFLLGGLCTVLGGYVAARLAGAHFLRHGAFVGGVSLLIGLIGFLFMPSENSSPLWYNALGVAAAIPCGALGGWVMQRSAATPEVGD